MLSKTALGGIWLYQTYVSPRKGFRCAYSVAHGGTGCSGYAKHAIRDHGLWSAIPKIRQRFRDCKSAHATLVANCAVHSKRADGDAPNTINERRKRQRRENRRDFCAECTFLGCLGWGGSSSAQDKAPDPAGLDCGGASLGLHNCDCGAGACDGCGGCSCDGCSPCN